MEQDDRYSGYERRAGKMPEHAPRLLTNTGADASPVQMQLSAISGHIDALEKGLIVLQERLAMVSRPAEKEIRKEGPFPPAASALAAALAEASSKLAELNRMVHLMEMRLEL